MTVLGEMSDFTAILDQPLPWPKDGDQLFVESFVSASEAALGAEGYRRHGLMALGYKEAGDATVERALSPHAIKDALVFPIVFLYRQYIELSLKQSIAAFGSDESAKQVWKTHNLIDLWNYYKEILVTFDIWSHKEADRSVELCIQEFSNVDPKSDAFRYPFDTKGQPLALSIGRLDLRVLRDTIRSLDGYFSGCFSYLADIHSP
jgi:hypothetical protein